MVRKLHTRYLERWFRKRRICVHLEPALMDVAFGNRFSVHLLVTSPSKGYQTQEIPFRSLRLWNNLSC
jgi:hypothetical protein